MYPETSLKDARIARDKARLLIADGTDPNEDKQRIKREEALDGGEAFSNIAKEWWEHQKGTWDESHATRVWRRLESNANPTLIKGRLTKSDHRTFCRLFATLSNEMH